MLNISCLALDEGLPDCSCATIEWAFGLYFVNGFVRTETGGYVAQFSPAPFEFEQDAFESAAAWAAPRGITNVYVRRFVPRELPDGPVRRSRSHR